MAQNYAKYATKIGQTPQTQPIAGTNQVPNNAGGFAWKISDWQQLNRFLILGSTGGTYYVSEKKLTEQNIDSILNCIKQDGIRVVNEIVKVSDGGHAAKNDPAIFVLALCFAHGNRECIQAAEQAVNKICRTGTHLFTFASYIKQLRGWGRTVRRAFQNWYESKDSKNLSYQVVKYQQRDGWSHRDILRLSHPFSKDRIHNAIYQYCAGKSKIETNEPLNWKSELPMIWAFEEAKNADKKNTIKLISEYGLPRECISTKYLSDSEVQEVLLNNSMPLTAMIRNLGNMTCSGLLSNGSSATNFVVQKLKNQKNIRDSRVHPMAILIALRTYQSGKGFKGSNNWNPVAKIVDALDDAFYLSFENVEPTGKRIKLALDVSGSMGSSVMGIASLSCREASAALAMITARTESDYQIMGFCNKLVPLNISPRQRLDDIIKAISNLPFGGTDCSLPIMEAINKKEKIDAFAVYTDNETYGGSIHPSEALVKYRKQSGIDSKLIVVGMSTNNVTIADENDSGMLDIVGLSTDTPNIMSGFIRGDF